MSVIGRLLSGACAVAISVAALLADSMPRESAAAPLSELGAPGQCSAFRIGLTPESAERERRADARRELAVREAERTALELRAYVVSNLDPQPPAIAGATPGARLISAPELEQAGAHLGRAATPAVLAANAALNATAARRYSFYDPEGRLIAETEVTSGDAPRIQYEYVWFGDMPLAQIEEPASGPAIISYYFADHLGTPILQTNELGEVVWRAEYEPFGGIHDIRVGESRDQPLRLPGQIADIGGAEADVYYNVHRFYRASWGRYTQPDPIGLEGGFNLFVYALDNPINYDDPLGLRVRMCCRNIPAFGIVGARHCFFQFEKSRDNRPLGLHGTQSAGGYTRAIFGRDTGRVRTDAPFDRGYDSSDRCGPWAEDPCNDIDECVRKAGNDYPDPSRYSLLGPNSNTFAFDTARKCFVMPPHPVNAPGWSSPPAPPQ